MDLVGKLSVTDGGNKYICVMVDYFKFGAPKRLLTDQGSGFHNKVNYSLCERLSIKRSLCCPYHPQTKLNGMIQRSLNKLVAEHCNRWDQYLLSTLFALRTKKQLMTQYSPYYLMFGREARYPLGPYEIYSEDILYLAPGKELESQLALDCDVAAGAVCH